MKLSEGFTGLIPPILIFVFYATSFTALTFSLKKIDLSMAYTVWAGVGTALIALLGMVYFREPLTVVKSLSICLIIIGVVGLYLEKNTSTTGY